MSLDSLLNALVDVYNKTPTQDSSGGQIPGFAPVVGLTGLPACIQPRRGSAPIALGQRQVFLSDAIYMSSNYGIQRGWKLVNSLTGQSYVVHAIVDMGGQGLAYRFDVIEET